MSIFNPSQRVNIRGACLLPNFHTHPLAVDHLPVLPTPYIIYNYIYHCIESLVKQDSYCLCIKAEAMYYQ